MCMALIYPNNLKMNHHPSTSVKLHILRLYELDFSTSALTSLALTLFLQRRAAEMGAV